MSDFSLMDAIECGIVKLPRVPIADNRADGQQVMYRNLWPTIRKKMPDKRKKSEGKPDPQKLPIELKVALDALYGHYEKTIGSGRRTASACRPSSSSSATTPRIPRWCATTSPASLRTDEHDQETSCRASSSSSGISTTTTSDSRSRGPS